MKFKSKTTLIIFLIGILAINLALTACGSETDAATEGNYIEKEIPLPEGVTYAADFYINDDKEIVLAGFNEDNSEGTLWRTSDKGENWEKLKTFTEGIDVDVPDNAYGQHIVALNDNGEIFYSVTWSGDEVDGKAFYYTITDDGTKTLDIKLSQEAQPYEGWFNHVFSAEYTDNGDLIFRDSELDLYRIDSQTGEILLKYNDSSSKIDYNNYTVSGENLYLFTTKKAYAFSLETGKEINVDKIIQGFMSNVKMATDYERIGKQVVSISEDNSDVYSVNYKGIKKFDGKNTEVLTDGSGTLLSLGNTYISTVKPMDEENILMIVSSTQGDVLLDFEYMPDMKKGTEEINLYMLKSKEINNASVFNEAIVMFERAHPEVKINLEVGVSGEDGITETDALKTLNSELLSGNGPDIIVLDDISVENFIDNDMLLDITHTIEEMNEQDELIENVVNNYQKNGRTYAAATLFSPVIITGSDEVIKSTESIDTLGAEVEKIAKDNKIPAIDESNSYDLPMILYNTYLSPLTTEGKVLDEDTVGKFYENLKKIMITCSDSESIRESYKWNNDMIPIMSHFRSGVSTNEEQMTLGYLSSMGELPYLEEIKSSQKGTYDFAGSNGLNLYAPQKILGINAKTEHEEISKKFIKYILSVEGQKTFDFGGGAGLYVNKKALAEDIAYLKEKVFGQETEISYLDHEKYDDGYIKVMVPELTPDKEKEIMDFIGSVKTPVNTDYILMDIIMGYAEDYLVDEATLEETTQKAMKKLKIYMEE